MRRERPGSTGDPIPDGRGRVFLTAAVGVVLIALLLFGIPWLLVHFVGNPIADGLPTVERVRWAFESGDIPARFWIGVLSVLVWACWAQLMLAFLLEMVAVFQSRPSRALPTFGLMQAVASQLVGMVLLAATVLGASPPLTAGAAAPSIEAVREMAARSDADSTPRGPQPSPSSDRVAGERLADPVTTSELVVVVDRRASLRSLAEKHLGSPDRWVELRDANVGSQMPDGTELVAGFTRLRADWTLRIPGVAASQDSSSGAAESLVHAVEPGDHLWSISAGALRDSLGREPTEAEVRSLWLTTIASNEDRLESGSADLIYPGERIDVTMPDGSPDPVASDHTDIQAPGEWQGVESASPEAANMGSEATSVLPIGLPESGATSVSAGIGYVAAASSATPETGEDRGTADTADRDATATADTADTVATANTEAVEDTENAADTVATEDTEAVEDAENAADTVATEDTEAVEDTENTAATAATVPAQPDGSIDAVRLGVGAAGLGLLASAFVRALRRRRRSQWTQRPVGMTPARAPEAALLEKDLVSVATPDRLDLLDRIGRSAFAELEPADRPGVSHVAVNDNSVCLVAMRRDEVPSSGIRGTALAGGVGWEFQRGSDDDPGSPSLSAAGMPGLLSLGRLPGGSDVLVNLGMAQVLGVSGDRAARMEFIRAAALELAVSPLADDLRVICCGVDGAFEPLQRIEVVDTADDAFDRLREASASLRQLLSESEDPNQLHAVLLFADELTADECERLQRLAPTGVAAVGPLVEDGWWVDLDEQGVTLHPQNIRLRRSGLEAPQLGAIEELVMTTSVDDYELGGRVPGVHEPDVVEPPQQSGSIDLRDVTAASVAEVAGALAEPSTEVQVLGSVSIVGSTKPFQSVRALDVVSFLAFHRDGATADQLRTWVWPVDEPPTAKAFANVMSRARTGLGVAADGELLLSRAGPDGVYRLSKEVGTDFDRFTAAVQSAERLEPGAAALQMKHALELVRGVPFTGGGATGFLWADAGTRAHVDYTVDEAAHACADLANSVGDTNLARWAALKGLTVIPGCEQCYRRRFESAALDGNRQELRAVMTELQRLAAADLGEPESSDLVSPQLLERFEELASNLSGATSTAKSPAAST